MEKLAYYWKRLRKNRLAYNLVLIGAIILAMAVAAHIVHAVVPVTAAHKGQSIAAEAYALHRSDTMLIQRLRV